MPSISVPARSFAIRFSPSIRTLIVAPPANVARVRLVAGKGALTLSG